MILQTRKRTPIVFIFYALYLYFSSLSLRIVSYILEPIIKRSHVAIWKWIQRHSSVFDSFKHEVKSIFIDETEINVGGKKAWVWIAFEPELKAFLSFY